MRQCCYIGQQKSDSTTLQTTSYKKKLLDQISYSKNYKLSFCSCDMLQSFLFVLFHISLDCFFVTYVEAHFFLYRSLSTSVEVRSSFKHSYVFTGLILLLPPTLLSCVHECALPETVLHTKYSRRFPLRSSPYLYRFV